MHHHLPTKILILKVQQDRASLRDQLSFETQLQAMPQLTMAAHLIENLCTQNLSLLQNITGHLHIKIKMNDY